MTETTTIQVSRLIQQELDDLKKIEGVKSYDDVIKILLIERKRSIPSTFGCLKKAPAFVRDEEEDSDRVPH
jgi:predicted CopG family antitoxin